MKKEALLIVIVVCITTTSFSQLSLSYNFSAEAPRLMHGIILEQTWNHHRAGVGLTMNQGYSPGYPDQASNWYLKPLDFTDYLGVIASYNYVFYPAQSEIEPYLFADIEYTKCGRRGLGFTNQDGNVSDPYPTLMPIIGFGFTTQIYQNFFYNMMAGVGFLYESPFAYSQIKLSEPGATYKVGVSVGYTFAQN
ncbi:MAG: hypothetical protein H7X71_04875 [Chitinophagales bacterium]|nr:hypothetical protein [Chitinophagales bacterium]